MVPSVTDAFAGQHLIMLNPALLRDNVVRDHMGFPIELKDARLLLAAVKRYVENNADADVERLETEHFFNEFRGMLLPDRRREYLGLPKASPWTVSQLRTITATKRQSEVLFWCIRNSDQSRNDGPLGRDLHDMVDEADVGRSWPHIQQALNQLDEMGFFRSGTGYLPNYPEIETRLQALQQEDDDAGNI
jgi:hypothetical protein